MNLIEEILNITQLVFGSIWAILYIAVFVLGFAIIVLYVFDKIKKLYLIIFKRKKDNETKGESKTV